MAKSYMAVISAALSSLDNPRYIIIDKATGVILDDNDGKEYPSAGAAYSAYQYKIGASYKQNVHPKEYKQIKEFCQQHMEIMDLFAKEELLIAKGFYGNSVMWNESFVQALLDEYGHTNLPFSMRELLKYWAKYRPGCDE